MRSETSQNSVLLTWRSFEALLDASSHCSEFWQSFGSYLDNKSLIRDLLLADNRPTIRKSVVKHVTQKCSSSSRYRHRGSKNNLNLLLTSRFLSSSQVSTASFAMRFWPIVAGLIPAATQRPEHCEEAFSLALTLFNKLANPGTPIDFFNLNDLVKEWGELLLAHSCVEVCTHDLAILWC
jgi:ubiquitin carboxyl-terminal hydrolase 34